jgi:F-type H+-transporting ATPase subunit alpha
MKQVAGTLRLDLAQYREMAAFAQFGSDLDKATQAQLARGSRLVEILKQPQYKPLVVERQILIIFAGTNGLLEMYPESVLQRYEAELYSFAEKQHPEVLKEIREKKALDAELEKKVKDLLEEFKGTFKAE